MEIRPIDKEEILRFSRIGSQKPKIFQEYLEALWKAGESRPEWCFIAEKNGRALGRLAYWALPSGPRQAFLFGLSLPWKKNYLEVGKELRPEFRDVGPDGL